MRDLEVKESIIFPFLSIRLCKITFIGQMNAEARKDQEVEVVAEEAETVDITGDIRTNPTYLKLQIL